ncbi:MAG TPA: LD-carboxypeptidase [Vicinamibacterales bacterium]|nr:LD-carboxypeptidase [Vicinamibacterales bacterium]
MLKPRALKPGSRIAVVAPASAFKREDFDAGVDEIRRLGFEPVFDSSVFATGTPAYLAGSAQIRAAAIRAALKDPSIDALIAVRGGYGSAQLLPLLDVAETREACKVFIGYSDLTAILSFLTTQCHMTAFHGPMLEDCLSRGEARYDRESLLNAIARPEPLGELSPDGLEVMHAGDARGVLLGGTVTQLLATLGTKWAFDPPFGYVLFFEEVGERPYRLDRMVTQLRQTGLLGRAAAIVIGELNGCDEPGGQLTGRGVMADVLKDFRGPVIAGFPSGHVRGKVYTLPLGVECRVVAVGRPRLVIDEAAVHTT